jgi:hypothetical protein
MKRRFFAVAIGLIFLWGCGKDVPDPPSGLIPRETFVELLAEVQLIEAVLNQNMIRNDEPRARIARYYKTTFETFKVTPQQFQETYTWYYGQPDLLLEIYDEVITVISTKRAI